MIYVMRAPDDPYPDVLHRIITARIMGDEAAASRALTEIRFEPKAIQAGAGAFESGYFRDLRPR
jgi:hypothetical protein